MTDKRLPMVFFLICLISITVFGQEQDTGKGVEGESVKASYMRDEFQFTVNAGVGFSAYQWHFTGGLQFDFNANPVLGAGVKATVDYGFDYGNLNINLYAIYKVWWFYFGPGVSFIVQGMTIPTDDPEYVRAYPYSSVASLAMTGGFRFPFVRIGPGFMTLDLSVDWYQTDIPLSEPAPPYSGTTLDELLRGSTYAFKFAARIGYTF